MPASVVADLPACIAVQDAKRIEQAGSQAERLSLLAEIAAGHTSRLLSRVPANPGTVPKGESVALTLSCEVNPDARAAMECAWGMLLEKLSAQRDEIEGTSEEYWEGIVGQVREARRSLSEGCRRAGVPPDVLATIDSSFTLLRTVEATVSSSLASADYCLQPGHLPLEYDIVLGRFPPYHCPVDPSGTDLLKAAEALSEPERNLLSKAQLAFSRSCSLHRHTRRYQRMRQNPGGLGSVPVTIEQIARFHDCAWEQLFRKVEHSLSEDSFSPEALELFREYMDRGLGVLLKAREEAGPYTELHRSLDESMDLLAALQSKARSLATNP